MKNTIKSVFQFLIFLSIGLFILYLLYQNQDAAYQSECGLKNIPPEKCSLKYKLIEDFKSVKIFWLLLICVLFMISNILRAFRWNQLLNPLGFKPKFINSLGTIMLGYFTNLAVPRIGEVVRAGTLAKYEKIPVEKIFGTIVVDRILDVISLLIVTGIAFIFSFPIFKKYYLENTNGDSSSLIYILMALAIVGLIGLYLVHRLVIKSKSENKLIKKIQGIVEGFQEGLLSIKKVKNIPFLLFNSIGIWFMYYLMTYLCFFAFEPTSHLGPVAGLVVFVFGALGIVLPSPGGMGSYQWLVSSALIIFGIGSIEAFSFSNIMFFTIQIFCNIAFGLFFLILLPLINSKKTI